MGMYRKKPIVIEAQEVPTTAHYSSIGEYVDACISLAEWCNGTSYMMHSTPESRYYADDPGTDHILIPTLEGNMMAMPGDWIIRGVAGEFYPCKDEIFQQTYEAVEAVVE